MPLWLAWISGIVLVVAFWTIVEAVLNPVPRQLSDGLQLGSALLVIPVARLRSRRWWLWGLIAGAPILLLLSTRLYSPLLQPMFAIAAVLLAEPGPQGASLLTDIDAAAEADGIVESSGGYTGDDEGDTRATNRPGPQRRRRRY